MEIICNYYFNYYIIYLFYTAFLSSFAFAIAISVTFPFAILAISLIVSSSFSCFILVVVLLLFTLFQQQTLRYRKQEFPYAKPCAKLYFHPEIRYTVNQLLLITLCKSSPSTSFSMYQFEYGGQTECFVYGEKYGKIIIC